MARDDDRELERLLAGGYLGGAEYDRIEQRVLDRVAPIRSAPLQTRWLWALLPAAALAVVLFRWAPQAPSEVSRGFVAKGDGDAALAGAVELACSSGGSCRMGDTLLFVVDSGLASGYLHARAEPVGDGGKAAVRLFPSGGNASPFIGAGSGTVVASEGVRLGPSFQPGSYHVKVWFSQRPDAAGAELPPEGAASLLLSIAE